MNEEFLHFLWRYRKITNPLRTHQGKKLVLVNPGFPNLNSGPDFFNARLIIDGVTWAGNVEIHINSSDWYRHKHQDDPAYQGVILHVVHLFDQSVFRRDGMEIPTLILKGKYNKSLFNKYKSMMESMQWIPCEGQIKDVDHGVMSLWLQRLAIERFERKIRDLDREFQFVGNDLNELLYRQIAGAFGFHINTEAFLQLARRLPYRLLERHRYEWFQVEALVFGQAGFLERDFVELYPQDLAREYNYLKSKYSLSPMEIQNWKFLRMRPAGFPTIRLAQFSQLMQLRDNFLTRMLEIHGVEDMIRIFQVQTSKYWEDHFMFDKLSSNHPKILGYDAASNVLLNGVIPFIFFYGKKRGRPDLCERALRFLEELPFEMNNITRKWLEMGFLFSSALESQALLELKIHYCEHKKCLNCSIGNVLLHESLHTS